jgi:hypothetical protein
LHLQASTASRDELGKKEGLMLPAAELILLCDERGAILEAGGPWLESWRSSGAREDALPATLLGWVSEAGAAQALDFLFELREAGAAFEHWIPLAGAGSVSLSLAFAGVVAGEQMWVIAASSEADLRAACRQWNAEGAALSPRPPRDAVQRLERLAGLGTAGGGAAGGGTAGREADHAGAASVPAGVPAGATASDSASGPAAAERSSLPASARALATLIRQAGVALFRDPLSSEQARLTAAIVRKADLLSSLWAGKAAGVGADGAVLDEPPKLDPLLTEAVAVHGALAAERRVTIELVLAAHLPRPSRPAVDYELAVDLLLAAAVDLARSGERVELEAGTGRRTLRLIARLSGTVAANTAERLAPLAAQLAAQGGSLHHTTERGRGDRVAIEIVADLPAGG